ncbi:MAG: trigger factor [Pseudobutyrivibrio sp.]|nr:trigger factor [Pseudobutyrivibrio sp.]
MNVQVEKLENNMAKLTITVDAAEVNKAITKAYNKQKNSISIPGFRKGKVPQAMVEKMYGAAIFYEDAANIMMQESYPQAYDESGLDIVSAPTVDVVQLEKGKDFIYTAEVALKPEVTLGKYKGVSVSKADVKVTAADVNAEIENVLKRNARKIEKTDAIVNGDVATIDFEGFMDGVAFEGGKGENYDLEIGSHSFIEGFEEALVGHVAGEDVDVNVTFPENYQATDLAGKPAVFKCHISKVTGSEVPKLDQEFVSDTSEFETVEEYKASVKERLETTKKNAAKDAQTEEAIAKIIEDSKMDIPEAMVEYQIDNMINEFANNMAQQGLQLEQYMQFTGMTMDGFREQVRPDAMQRIQSSLVLEAIAKAENIEATDADVDAEIEEMAKMYGMEADQLKTLVGEGERASMKKELASKKAVDFIMENVKEAAKKTTKKAAAADAEATEAPAEEKPKKTRKTTKKTEEKADAE